MSTVSETLNIMLFINAVVHRCSWAVDYLIVFAVHLDSVAHSFWTSKLLHGSSSLLDAHPYLIRNHRISNANPYREVSGFFLTGITGHSSICRTHRISISCRAERLKKSAPFTGHWAESAWADVYREVLAHSVFKTQNKSSIWYWAGFVRHKFFFVIDDDPYHRHPPTHEGKKNRKPDLPSD